jgi:hypothetical protein
MINVGKRHDVLSPHGLWNRCRPKRQKCAPRKLQPR